MNLWIQILIFLSALFPVIILLVYVRYRDRKNPEPWSKILLGIALGVASVFMTNLFLSTVLKPLSSLSVFDIFFQNSFINSVYRSVYLAAIPEETVKLLCLWILLKVNSDYDEVIDGIVYSVCIGLGFAGYENLIYLFSNESSWQTIAIVRCIFAVPGHYIYAILMGFFFSLVKFYPQKYGVYKLLVWLAPITAHAVYDFICMYGSAERFMLLMVYSALMVFSIMMHILCLKYFKKLELMDQDQEDLKIFTNAMKNPENQDSSF